MSLQAAGGRGSRAPVLVVLLRRTLSGVCFVRGVEVARRTPSVGQVPTTKPPSLSILLGLLQPAWPLAGVYLAGMPWPPCAFSSVRGATRTWVPCEQRRWPGSAAGCTVVALVLAALRVS